MRTSKYRHIIKAFEQVISALESNTTRHGFKKASTSNMGLVTQALLGVSEQWLDNHLRMNDSSHYYNRDFRYYHKTYSAKKTWWAEWTHRLWPMNGNPKYGTILRRLQDAGLDRDDLADIEWLNNPIINKMFEEKVPMGTKKVPIMETHIREIPKKIFKTVEWKEEHYRKDWWGRLWGFKETVIRTEQYEDDIEMVEEEYQVQTGEEEISVTKEYTNKEHVIAYYKLWVEHLKSEVKRLDELKKVNKRR